MITATARHANAVDNATRICGHFDFFYLDIDLRHSSTPAFFVSFVGLFA
jgi:hypothetical protein